VCVYSCRSRQVSLLTQLDLHSAEDIDGIRMLYERAVSDFLSVPLWCAYIQVRVPKHCPLTRGE
jgi:hypothetical protein